MANLLLASYLLQEEGEGPGILAAGIGLVFGLFGLAFSVFMIVCVWKVFSKAGQPGWASIVPIYNAVVMLNIVGRPIWWLVLFLIPFVNIGVGIVLCIDTAKVFGKGPGFGVGLLLLPFIFYPMLAFGDAQYRQP